jgi:hypothetical protein
VVETEAVAVADDERRRKERLDLCPHRNRTTARPPPPCGCEKVLWRL